MYMYMYMYMYIYIYKHLPPTNFLGSRSPVFFWGDRDLKRGTRSKLDSTEPNMESCTTRKSPASSGLATCNQPGAVDSMLWNLKIPWLVLKWFQPVSTCFYEHKKGVKRFNHPDIIKNVGSKKPFMVLL